MNDGSSNSTVIRTSERWYAVCCKQRHEVIAEENLRRQGYHTYLPRICNTRRRKGQWVSMIEPLFPRYLFIQVDPNRHSTAPIRSTRGTVGLVRFGGQPAVVPEEVIETLLQREVPGTGLHQDNHPLFYSGEPIRLVEGPLVGMEGVFAEEDGDKRVIVMLELLGKANHVRLNRDWIAPAV